MGRSFITLGLWHRPWEEHGRIVHSEIGYYDSELFEAEKWKPNYPNPAFNRMDDADGYWGAKIVTAFSHEVIEKLAQAGAYSRSEVTASTRFSDFALCPWTKNRKAGSLRRYL